MGREAHSVTCGELNKKAVYARTDKQASAGALAAQVALCGCVQQHGRRRQRVVKFIGYVRRQQPEGPAVCCYFWSGVGGLGG